MFTPLHGFLPSVSSVSQANRKQPHAFNIERTDMEQLPCVAEDDRGIYTLRVCDQTCCMVTHVNYRPRGQVIHASYDTLEMPRDELEVRVCVCACVLVSLNGLSAQQGYRAGIRCGQDTALVGVV